jgi:hypothetical protein
MKQTYAISSRSGLAAPVVCGTLIGPNLFDLPVFIRPTFLAFARVKRVYCWRNGRYGRAAAAHPESAAATVNGQFTAEITSWTSATRPEVFIGSFGRRIWQQPWAGPEPMEGVPNSRRSPGLNFWRVMLIQGLSWPVAQAPNRPPSRESVRTSIRRLRLLPQLRGPSSARSQD